MSQSPRPRPSGPTDADELYSFFGLSSDDGERMRAMTTLVEEHRDQVVEDFYAHLTRFEPTRSLLADDATTARLKDLQKTYLNELFQGDYGEAYRERRLRTGQTHYRVGLEPRWYLGAYHLHQRLLFPIIAAHLAEMGEPYQVIVEHLLSVTKVMTLDLELSLEAYFRSWKEALQAEQDRLEESTEELQETNIELNALRRQLEDRIEERTSALQASEERLRQSENLAAIGKITSLLAHEIRNPLSSVVLNLELLSDELDIYDREETTEARALLESVLQEVNRINRNTRDYLTIARPPEVRLTQTEISPVIESQIAFLQAELGQAGVTVSMHLADDLPHVNLDAELFRQVLLNLVKNSLDAMPNGGQLHISTAAAGGNLSVVVRDTGVGISRADKDRIFEPLFTSKTKGLGMGLAFVHEVISAHDGRIRCASEEGVGTTFTIELPAA